MTRQPRPSSDGTGMTSASRVGRHGAGLASRRPDGTLRPYVTMWVVQTGGNLYVRSAYGPDNPW